MNHTDFKNNLQKYAELLVKTGVNVQPGHTVLLNIAVDQAPLAELIVKEAYALGAANVVVNWSNQTISKAFFDHADGELLSTVPDFQVAEADYYLEKGASRISVVSEDPDGLKGIDHNRLATFQKARGAAFANVRQATQANKVSWCVAAAAGSKWAAKVFPELATTEEQVAALWDQIFKTTRVYTEDPALAWETHHESLLSKAELLNAEQFDALHYSAPGTDLTIGLPENHLWEGAGSYNVRGERFMANMPTEEVFTAPDYRRIDGVVRSTKPLSYAGNILLDMEFTFEKGSVVKATAGEGQAVLDQLLATDEGARSLGEVALVPDPSPISQSGITFFNTLFDENASNHLALGSAYAFSLKGGTEMSEDELKAAGLNRSHTHVDFMIGSDQMDIDGIRKDGSRVPIFRKGNWA